MKPNTEIKDRFHIAEDKKESLLPKTGKKKKLEKDRMQMTMQSICKMIKRW